MTVDKQVPSGWSFYTADFSMKACRSLKGGYVMLIRDIKQKDKWHRLDERAQESIPLYATGTAETFEEALKAACNRASEIGRLD